MKFKWIGGLLKMEYWVMCWIPQKRNAEIENIRTIGQGKPRLLNMEPRHSFWHGMGLSTSLWTNLLGKQGIQLLEVGSQTRTDQ